MLYTSCAGAGSPSQESPHPPSRESENSASKSSTDCLPFRHFLLFFPRSTCSSLFGRISRVRLKTSFFHQECAMKRKDSDLIGREINYRSVV